MKNVWKEKQQGQAISYKHRWFQSFLVLLLPLRENTVIKRNTKSGLITKSSIKENAPCNEKTASFETHTQQAFPKIICGDLLCATRNIEINCTLQHLISQLPEMSYKPFRSNALLPRGAPESMLCSKRNGTAHECCAQNGSSEGTRRLYFLFYKLPSLWKRSNIRARRIPSAAYSVTHHRTHQCCDNGQKTEGWDGQDFPIFEFFNLTLKRKNWVLKHNGWVQFPL